MLWQHLQYARGHLESQRDQRAFSLCASNEHSVCNAFILLEEAPSEFKPVYLNISSQPFTFNKAKTGLGMCATICAIRVSARTM